MRSDRKTGARAAMTLTAAAALLAAGCSTISAPEPQPITHIVLMWLKHPARAADRAQLIRAAQSLRIIPGVIKVETGRSLPSRFAPTLESKIDRSFDLAVAVTFRDRAALERYNKDPRHVAAVDRYLRPLVRHYEVYNLDAR